MPRSLSLLAITFFAGFLSCCWLHNAYATESVNVDNFVRAETDLTFKRYVDQGAFGKFFTYGSQHLLINKTLSG